MLKLIPPFVLSSVLTAILMVAVSTQNTFSGLRKLGVNASGSKQLSTTLTDITGTGPLLGVIVAIGFLIALPVASLIYKKIKKLRGIIFWLAGMACVFVILFGMEKAFFGTPLLQGAREPLWMFMTMLCGGAGSALFARLTKTRSPGA